MGCYDDIEAADAFVLWGSNMAEMHPILWTRVTDRRLSRAACHASPCCRPSSTARSSSPTSRIVFKPQTDLVILNAIANHIIKTGRVNKDFVDKHTAVQARPDRHRLRPAARASAAEEGDRTRPRPATATDISFDEYAKFVVRLHAGESGRDVRRADEPARGAGRALRRPEDQGHVSFWTMGFNQHTRGVWCNNLVYNIHLLTGKISEPGNSPFSLTGQPSACGTAREVGTFSHRLPADMVVTNKAHRDKAEKIWKLPEGTIPDKPGYHAVLQNRMLKDGKLNAYWVQVNNNLQAGANINEEGLSGLPQSRQFHRRVRRLSDRHRARRRPHPADRDVGREGRRLRQRRAAHAVLAPAGRRAGRGALGPLAADGVLEALQDRGSLAGGADREEAGVPRQDAVRRALQERPGRQVSRVARSRPATRTTSRRRSASTSRRACSRNTPRSAAATATTSRRSTPIIRCAACAGRWSTARKRAGATARARSLREAGHGRRSSTAIPTARRASSRCPTSRRPNPRQGISVLALDRPRARALAFRHR